MIESQAEFGLRLLRELLQEQGAVNLCISPASISLALSAALDGASGETRRAIAATLSGGELEAGALLDAAGGLRRGILQPGAVFHRRPALRLRHPRRAQRSAVVSWSGCRPA